MKVRGFSFLAFMVVALGAAVYRFWLHGYRSQHRVPYTSDQNLVNYVSESRTNVPVPITEGESTILLILHLALAASVLFLFLTGFLYRRRP
ncbi:hypothetical protein ABI_02020 [Asticcacaulis biprosthecium C19]|uniref:Uncharacterized protein n=1 Tax=Asticcacaulis biprosthecium C19 TaxID=715226 RepID=F4QID4_9CAUL|nr:hypothetical protein [Asticcacaulis biprosthecium]EGF91772.1 hypothetical protein ABI_02020 [Asticcacaulis biprosthecium C19]